VETWLLMLAGGLAAGAFGSLLGLGGGVLIVPLLTLGFDLPLRDAIGVSLACVVATSAAAASTYLERRVADLRLAMRLELFTAAGAVAGGLLAFALDEQLLAGLFALVLVYVAATMVRRAVGQAGPEASPDAISTPLKEQNLPLGAAGSTIGGVVSGLLGIGGGVIIVPLMHLGLGLPLRVATATSTVMIAVTAAASGIVYLVRGGIDPYVLGPTAVGVFVGAILGSRSAERIDLRILRLLFIAVLVYTAAQMVRRAIAPT
jgi:uncharacterized membrane protein YfcA